MKAGSKKRQKPRKRYFKKQIMKGFREKLFKFEPQNDRVHTHTLIKYRSVSNERQKIFQNESGF